MASAQVIVALPLDMPAHGLGTAQIGWLLGLNGVLIVIAQPIALRFVRGFSHAQWLAAGSAVTGLGLATMIAPVLGSLVLSRLGGGALWIGCLIACSIAAILHATVSARRTGDRWGFWPSRR